VGRSIRKLYIVENELKRYRSSNRNSVRAVIAYVKLLYDFGQQMLLSRSYLLHKIKLLEVRENDLNLEISVLRGVTTPVGVGHPSFGSATRNASGGGGCEQGCETELDIIIGTRMIKEIDYSQGVLQDLSLRIAEKKKTIGN